MVTTPSFAVTMTAADFSDGSENILALISVAILSSLGLLLHETDMAATNAMLSSTEVDFAAGMNPPQELLEA
jgi:hypothetical protein